MFLFVGLKKFLSQYPALFYIDGDYVHINDFKSVHNADTCGNRDYIEETKHYFKNKLLQYGIGTEVPIKSLLGHRSQASPQVRHISGQHIREFTDFLLKHPDMFKVIDENVLLVGCENEVDVPLEDRLHLPEPSINTKATQELLDFIVETIEAQGPTIVFQLFHLITSKFPQEQWFRMFKTPSDLSTFLKMFSDYFHVQADLVSVCRENLHKPKLSDTIIQHASQQNSLYHRTSTIESNSQSLAFKKSPSNRQLSNSSSKGGHATVTAQLSSGSVPTKMEFKLNEPVSKDSLTTQKIAYDLNKSSEPNSGFDSLVTEIKLDNLCPSNVPKIWSKENCSNNASKYCKACF